MVFTSRGRRMCRLESMARALQMVFILLFFSIAFVQKKLCLVMKHIIKGERDKVFRRHHPQKSYMRTHYITPLQNMTRLSHTI